MNRNRTGGTLWRCLPVAVFCAASSFAQVSWTLRNPLTPTVTLHTAVWTGSFLFIAGDSGTIARSSTGTGSWTSFTTGTTSTINGVTGNASLIVAVGQSGMIRSAPAASPTVWTSRVSGTTQTLHGISPGGSWYVVVGDSGTILTSADGSTAWTRRFSPTTRSLRSAEFGSNLYLAVGDTGTIVTSSNGTDSWTVRTSGTTSNLRRVRYANNLYVAVGEGGTILTSTNGTSNWTVRVSGTSRRLSGLHYGNSLWVAVGDSGTILTSTNGTSWTTRTSGVTAALYEVAWTGSRFVAVGAGGVLLTSTNGTTNWSGSAPVSQTLNGIAWGEALYAAVGAAGTMVTSPDGTAWTTRASGTEAELTAVSDDGALFVAVGDAGVIRTSTNGTTWTARTSGTTGRFNFVRWGGGLFVAVGDAGLIATSPDGLSWTLRNSGISSALHATAWVNGQHYVTGASGVMLASPDGASWTPRTSGTTATLHALRWTGSRLVAVGTGGTVLLSPDGMAWERFAVGYANALHGLLWTGSNLVAVGAGGIVVTSPNGVTWGLQNSGTSADLRDVDWNGSQFAVVGVGGTILTATAATLPTAPPTPVPTSPAADATNITDNPVGLGWQPGSGAVVAGTTYRVQLSTDPLFASTVLDDSGFTTTSRNVGPLAANSVFYWRVRAKNGGYSSYWTEARRFSTETTPAPVLISPAHNAVGVASSTTLQWGAVSGALAYRVQLSTTSDFSAVILDDSTLTGLTRSLNGLAVNTVYHWRVRAQSAAGTSAWSTTRSFTTVSGPPAAPVLTAPAQSATAVSVFSSLTWNAVLTATGYRVQVATDSLFATVLRDDSLLTSPEWRAAPPAQLPGSTTLYWRALARNQIGAGAWSAVRRFTTAPTPTAPPPAPLLTAPLQFAVNLPVSTALLWNVVTEASHYRVQLSTQPNFSTVLVDDSTLTSLQKNLTSLAGSTDYFWRVNARNPIGTGPWSDVWTFRTVAAAPTVAPALLSPSAFSSGIAIPATLGWSAVSGATSYRVQVSTVPDFSVLVFNNGGITALTTPTSALAGFTDYYWRVAAVNAAGTGPYSSVWRFTTGALPLPDAPSLVSPAPFAVDVPLSPNFVWTASSLASNYHLQVSTSPDFAIMVINDSVRVSTSAQTLGSLQAGRDYYWRMRARNASGVSAWTATSRFTTLTTLSLSGQMSLTRNVATGGGQLRFLLPHRQRVTVRLLDLRGRLAAPVLDEIRDAGVHAIELPAGGEGALRLLEFRTGKLRQTLILQP